MLGLSFDIFANDKTGRAFEAVEGKVHGLEKSFEGLKKTALVLAGGEMAFEWLKGAAEGAEHINDLSERLKINARVLSEYQLIAGETGSDLDSVAKAMQLLAKNSVEAADKQGEARQALNDLGINAKKFNELPIDTKFAVVAEAIEGVEDPSKRVEIAMALMGKSGAEMLQVMAEGGDGLQDMQRKADGLGITLNNTETGAIDSMMDAFGDLGLQAKALAQHFIAQVAPAVELVAKALQVVLAGAIVIVRDGFKAMVQVILNAIGYVANGFAWLTDKLSALPGEAGEAFASISKSLRSYGDILTNVEMNTDGLTESQKKQNVELGKTSDILAKVKGSLPNAKNNNDVKVNNQLLSEAKRIYEQTRTPLEKYNEQMEKLKKLFDSKLIDSDTFQRAQNKAFDDLQNAMKATGKTSGDVLGQLNIDWRDGAKQVSGDWIDALMGIGGGFDSLREKALSNLKEIGASMLKNLFNQAIGGGQSSNLPWLQSSSNSLPWLSQGGSSGGGFLSNIGSSISNFFGGFFADGGNFMGGKPIVVGERGAEVIMPRSGGTVIPNHALGRPVTVSVNISTPNANSFRSSEGQIKAAMAEAVRRGSRNL